MIVMKNSKPKVASTEINCSACDGTGFPAVAQPKQPGRKMVAAWAMLPAISMLP
jgi:hypothetical protein